MVRAIQCTPHDDFFKSLKLIDHYIFNILAINMLRRLVIFRYFDAERDSEREGEV